ncbi:MAG: peptidylprolyl isomerase [Gemmatimonadota bacterium]
MLALALAAWLAQAPADSLVPLDRIVAVVGDTIILHSELQEQMLQLQGMGAAVPRDAAGREAFLRDLLEQRIDDLVLLIQARKESITVSDAEVNAEVDERLAQIRRRFQGELEFLRALEATGQTLTEFRLHLTQQVRNDLMIQRYLQAHQADLTPEPVGESEIREFFERQRQAMGPKPFSISFFQVVIRPQPSDSVRAAAREEAEQVLAELRAGADFTVLARRHSDDLPTRDEGGDLGWFRHGTMVRPFEEAVYALRAGQTSSIVESGFGYHIIRLDRVRGSERRARHILIRPELTPADVERTAALADSLAQVVRSGAATVRDLATRFGDPEEQVEVANFPRDRLPPGYADALADAPPGDLVGPFRVRGPNNVEKLALVRVTDAQPGGEWTLDDVRDQIRAQLQQQKMLEKFVERLRDKVYVEDPDVRP